MSVRVVALGDSLSCGEGVGLRLDPALTWPALLAAALPGGGLTSLARPGARVAEVLAHQLPVVATLRPDLVTVLAGLNDVVRADPDPDRVARELRHTVAGVVATGATVLLCTLPEPGLHLPLPPALRRVVRRRAAAVDAVVRAAGEQHGCVEVLDLAGLDGLQRRRAWEVDRVHPNASGHAMVAGLAAAALRRRGWEVGAVAPRTLPVAPGALREARWLLRDGLPWLVRHSGSVVVPAARLSLRPSV